MDERKVYTWKMLDNAPNELRTKAAIALAKEIGVEIDEVEACHLLSALWYEDGTLAAC